MQSGGVMQNRTTVIAKIEVLISRNNTNTRNPTQMLLNAGGGRRYLIWATRDWGNFEEESSSMAADGDTSSGLEQIWEIL